MCALFTLANKINFYYTAGANATSKSDLDCSRPGASVTTSNKYSCLTIDSSDDENESNNTRENGSISSKSDSESSSSSQTSGAKNSTIYYSAGRMYLPPNTWKGVSLRTVDAPK